MGASRRPQEPGLPPWPVGLVPHVPRMRRVILAILVAVGFRNSWLKAQCFCKEDPAMLAKHWTRRTGGPQQSSNTAFQLSASFLCGWNQSAVKRAKMEAEDVSEQSATKCRQVASHWPSSTSLEAGLRLRSSRLSIGAWSLNSCTKCQAPRGNWHAFWISTWRLHSNPSRVAQPFWDNGLSRVPVSSTSTCQLGSRSLPAHRHFTGII